MLILIPITKLWKINPVCLSRLFFPKSIQGSEMKVETIQPLQLLMQAIKDFHEERDWDQFHSPKNLAMNLYVEVAEIAECFR